MAGAPSKNIETNNDLTDVISVKSKKKS